MVGFQHVVGYCVFHNAIARNAVFVKLHLYGGLLARLIEPVGVVGHRNKEVIAAVGIVFGMDLSP